ncbi:MAG: hypothetical protein V1725_06940 [archaeon]
MNARLLLFLFSLLLACAPLRAENFNVDIDLPSTYAVVTPGKDIWFTINVLNLATENRIDIALNYDVQDEQENIIVSRAKTVAIETQASFVADLALPKDLPPGQYVLHVLLTSPYGNSTAETSIIVRKEQSFPWQYAVAVVGLLIVLGLIAYEYRKSFSVLRVKAHVHAIVKKRFRKKD